MIRALDAPPDCLGDEGSGTVNSLGLIALAITLSLLLAGVGAARTAAVRLQAVADLAALAGAERSAISPWEDVGAAPCDAVASVTAANEVGVESCEVLGSDCRVIVSEFVRIMGVSVEIRAKARAGQEQ